MTAPLCRLAGLTVRYRDAARPALTDIDLDVATGERLAVIGASGSGKSTLARAIAGLLPQGCEVAGAIDWPASGTPPAPGRDLAMVFQDPGHSLDPVLSVGEQVAEGAWRHLGLGRRAGYVHARDLLAAVGLSDPDRLLGAFPHQLSGGQRQRVAIAAAIAARPRILIADEVTSALDSVVQAEIVRLLGELVARGGMTLILVTHDIALAAGLADRIAVIDGGRLAEVGPATQLVAAPASAAGRALLAAHIDLDTPPLVEPLP